MASMSRIVTYRVVSSIQGHNQTSDE